MSSIAKSVLMILIQIVPDPNVGSHFKSCFRMFHRFIPKCFSNSSINTFYPRALLLITVLSIFRFVHISKKNYFSHFPHIWCCRFCPHCSNLPPTLTNPPFPPFQTYLHFPTCPHRPHFDIWKLNAGLSPLTKDFCHLFARNVLCLFCERPLQGH